MKKEQKAEPLKLRKSSFLKALMMLVFSMFSLAVSAQSTATSATAVQPANAQSDNETQSSLVQFQKNNPSDAQAAQAVRYEMILANPAAYPEFGQADLDRMQAELNQIMPRINFIQEQAKQGVSAEQAGVLYQRNLDAKTAMDKATNPDKYVAKPAPATDTAPALINGNN